MSFNRKAALLCSALFAYASGALAIPVQSLPPKPGTVQTRSVSVTKAETLSSQFLTLGIGLGGSDDSFDYHAWGGLTLLRDQTYLSLRGAHMHSSHGAGSPPSTACSDNCYSNLNEEALIFGLRLGSRSPFWIGTGIARLQRTKGEGPAPNFVSAGLPLEIALFAPRHSTLFGFDGRLHGNINGHQNFVALSLGLRFGR